MTLLQPGILSVFYQVLSKLAKEERIVDQSAIFRSTVCKILSNFL